MRSRVCLPAGDSAVHSPAQHPVEQSPVLRLQGYLCQSLMATGSDNVWEERWSGTL